MDPEFQRLVEANPGPDDAWHVQLSGCLCSQLFSEYLLLKRADGDESDRDSSLLAWRGRNLLELTAWSL